MSMAVPSGNEPERAQVNDASADHLCVEELLVAGLPLRRVVELLRGRLEENEVNAVAREVLTRHPDAELGVTVLQRSPSAVKDSGFVAALVSSLSSEASDELLDPLFGELMDDPGVLSSGFIVDRRTALDDQGRLKFTTCPWSKSTLKHDVYPLLSLKSKLQEFKENRLSAMITTAETLLAEGNRSQFDEVIEAAENFLDDLGDAVYIHKSRKLADLRLKAAKLPNRALPAKDFVQIYTRIRRTLGPDEEAWFQDEVETMAAKARLAMKEGRLGDAKAWCDACVEARSACKVFLPVAVLLLDFLKLLFDRSAAPADVVQACTRIHNARARSTIGTVQIPCGSCGLAIGPLRNNPYLVWICDCRLHMGHNRFQAAHTLYGCGTILRCDWGICQVCWDKERKRQHRFRLEPQSIASCSGEGSGAILGVGRDGAVELSAGDGNSGRQKWTLESSDGKAYRIALTGGLEDGRAFLAQARDSGEVILKTEESLGQDFNWGLQECAQGKYRIVAEDKNRCNETHCLTCTVAGSVVLSAVDLDDRRQWWTLKLVFAESAVSETQCFLAQVGRIKDCARSALAESRLDDAKAWCDAYAEIDAACELKSRLAVARLRLDVAKARGEDLHLPRVAVLRELQDDPAAAQRFADEEGVALESIRDLRPTQLLVTDVDDRTTQDDEWHATAESPPLDGAVARIDVVVDTFADQEWGNAKANLGLALYAAGGHLLCRCNLFGTFRSDSYNPGTENRYSPARAFQGNEDILTRAGPGCTYRLEYTVGGGGGHSISVRGWRCTIFPEGYTSSEPGTVVHWPQTT